MDSGCLRVECLRALERVLALVNNSSGWCKFSFHLYLRAVEPVQPRKSEFIQPWQPRAKEIKYVLITHDITKACLSCPRAWCPVPIKATRHNHAVCTSNCHLMFSYSFNLSILILIWGIKVFLLHMSRSALFLCVVSNHYCYKLGLPIADSQFRDRSMVSRIFYTW